jgi:hypothetical protein
MSLHRRWVRPGRGVNGLLRLPSGARWLCILSVKALCAVGACNPLSAAVAQPFMQAKRTAEVASAGGAAGAPRARAREHTSKPEVPYDRTLELQGVRFHVISPNDSSINRLTIIPSGLEIDNSTLTRDVDGSVIGAEVADLNADGSPEIYVYVASAGSGSYGSLVAYSANRRKSLSEIYLAPLTEHEAASRGYMGHDEFAVAGTVLLRRFPVYRATDTNARPTSGTRQVQYKLEQGEAGWLLKLYRSVDH